MRPVFSCSLRLGLLLACFCALLSGQDKTNRRTVTIEVMDPTGTGIPHAEVRLSRLPDFARHKLETADDGKLTLRLRPGAYTLLVACAGFKTSSTRITVRDAKEIQTISVGLQIGDTGSPMVYQDAVTPNDAYELYSWPQSNGIWNFCLLPSPSGVNIPVEVIFNRKFRLTGVDQLERKISLLPTGASILWMNRITSGQTPTPESRKLALPPTGTIERVNRYAGEHGVHLEVPRSTPD